MIRIVHLMGREASFEQQRGVMALARGLGEGFESEVVRIGSGESCRSWLAAARMMRRRAGQMDLVHVWDGVGLAAGIGAGVPMVVSMDVPPGRGMTRWLRAVMAYRDVQVVASTATARRICVERGMALQRCHMIRPAVDFGAIASRRDAGLRRELGFTDEDYVMLAVGESTPPANHELAVWASGILNVLDRSYKLLAWGRGGKSGKLARFARSLKQGEMIRLAERTLGRPMDFEKLLPAADLLLYTARGAQPTLPLAMGMAAGLPIVSTVTYTSGELLEDHHNALMTPKATARMLAQRVMSLRYDSGLQWELSDRARVEAFEYFSTSRFLEQYRSLYRQMMEGKEVHIPDIEPGAGTRFHGRAG
ncbi:MAG: glycosyltransferase family 4 protein [Phycisphaerales bacterium]|nr:glycosyltransferase family 4 protein [Phycisphaerales bacterium]